LNDTATTEIYTLSLHDALPISPLAPRLTSLIVTFLGERNNSYSPFHSPSSSLLIAVLRGSTSTCGGPVFFKTNGAVLPASTKSPARVPSALRLPLNVA